MKMPIIQITNLSISQTDNDLELQTLSHALNQHDDVLFYAVQHNQWIDQLYAYLHADLLTNSIHVESERQFKILFLDWLDDLELAPVNLEYIVNFFLKHIHHPQAQAILSLLHEINWTPYLSMRLNALTPNLLGCVKFVLCIALNPQIICLNNQEIENLVSNENMQQWFSFCQTCGISLILCSHRPQSIKLCNLTVIDLDDLLIVAKQTQPEIDTESLPSHQQQAWIVYHEIKKHITTDEFKQSSEELQAKINSLYDQYEHQLKEYDARLLETIPSDELSTNNEWLNQSTNLTNMLFDETLSESELQEEITRRITSSFEPVEITEPFKVEANEESTDATTTDTINFTKTKEVTEHLTEPQPTTHASTILIPPDDIDKIKKPKQNWKELFHSKEKK